jgi:hypothetical protein
MYPIKCHRIVLTSANSEHAPQIDLIVDEKNARKLLWLLQRAKWPKGWKINFRALDAEEKTDLKCPKSK